MITMHAIALETFVPMLRTLGELLDRGAERAAAKKFDVAVLAESRLAPDMFPLAKHVVIACDNAEEAIARLRGGAFSKSEGDESFDGVRARVKQSIERLEKIAASSLEGSEARPIEIPVSKEMGFRMTGLEYVRDWAIPQFYFHVAITYAILRHVGVELGMRDWGARAGAYLRPLNSPG